MRHQGRLRKDENAKTAAWEATRGGVVGAARGGLYASILSAGGYFKSQIYRGLTVQFKIYLAMSVMTFSSMIEADRRMRVFKEHVRDEERFAREEERGKAWARYFEEVESDAD